MDMDKEKKYERMYDILLDYEQKVHLKNQKRIRIGLKCLIIIPLIFLVLLFWTGSSKTIFLVLWIVSLFILASYLIFVEYGDYQLQEKLNELVERENAGVESLLEPGLLNVEGSIRNVAKRVDETFCIEGEEQKKDEEHN